MRLIKNTGSDRVVDELRTCLAPGSRMDLASPGFSLYAFAEVKDLLDQLGSCQPILPGADGNNPAPLGSGNDRSSRNQLLARHLARQCSDWTQKNCEVRPAPAFLPQFTIITSHPDVSAQRVITGSCPLTTDGLGLTPGNQFSLIQCSEGTEEWSMLGGGVPRSGTGFLLAKRRRSMPSSSALRN